MTAVPYKSLVDSAALSTEKLGLNLATMWEEEMVGESNGHMLSYAKAKKMKL